MSWAHVGTVILAAFLASLVEFVETSKRGVIPGPGRAGLDRAEAVEEGIS